MNYVHSVHDIHTGIHVPVGSDSGSDFGKDRNCSGDHDVVDDDDRTCRRSNRDRTYFFGSTDQHRQNHTRNMEDF